MSIIAYEIESTKSYGFRILTSRSDSRFEEMVRAQIDQVMGSFKREEGAAHSVRFIIIDSIDLPERTEPELEPGKQYLIFEILPSMPDPAELEKIRGDTERWLLEFIGDSDRAPRVGSVILANCTVERIALRLPGIPFKSIEGLGSVPGYKSKWDPEGRGIERPWYDKD